ncbi:hypothetical protein BU23DRAFT_489786 [Bimuria novae-zelandiae CBS 107.79]|uniref:Cryptic loci regulator 2 N-terminal domain-containing protein n=1 Tax=Bimuria novae-zelandiae CBS 107.79 TaxID=1447943 RepID=A0A6A5UKB1_9PLEO|nr:hypothetical protein BU23DRAFT_489786 [Bimuria novae-zelandiae CBS 107.79]
MSQPLTLFWPVFALRSDGRTVVNNKGTPVRNGPTESQLDRTPNEQGQSDFYRLIEKEDAKHVDWRKKLGGMLLREVGRKEDEDKWQQCILWDFPEGYRLYEHIKSKTNGETKNHSGGGHDRQDAYLYGYPKGPRKRFRSPVEFFPHLLWMLTDESSDYSNCTCRICSPNQIEVEKPAQPARPADITSATAIGARTISAPNGPVPVSRTPMPMPIRRPSTDTPVAQSPVTKPATPVTPLTAQSSPQIKAPPRLEPTPLPQLRTQDQQVDSQYNKFVNRPGEVVWFRRQGGDAFGLGLITRRWITDNGSNQAMYSIQPLSYPGFTPAEEHVDAGLSNVKPWLAWSVPSCTYEYLRQNPHLTYCQVDWKYMASGRMGDGHAEVDASILMAKAVDITYTPFERIKTVPSNGSEDRYWNGIYYGAEKIWRGEPVRLRLGMGSDVLVVTEIIEKTSPTGTNPLQTSSKVELRGDVYSYATLPAPNPKAPPALPSDNHLPLRMREDMRWRNQILLAAASGISYWKLISPNQRIAIEDVKGRWYETSILFQREFFEAVQNKGNVNGSWMNARGDATGMGRGPGVLCTDRLAAFSGAIPDQLRIVDGLAPPKDHEKPSGSMQEIELSTGAPAESNFSVDDFMNFEDPSLPFGENNFI